MFYLPNAALPQRSEGGAARSARTSRHGTRQHGAGPGSPSGGPERLMLHRWGPAGAGGHRGPLRADAGGGARGARPCPRSRMLQRGHHHPWSWRRCRWRLRGRGRSSSHDGRLDLSPVGGAELLSEELIADRTPVHARILSVDLRCTGEPGGVGGRGLVRSVCWRHGLLSGRRCGGGRTIEALDLGGHVRWGGRRA